MRIDNSKFESAILASNLKHTAKASRVTVHGASGRSVIVPSGKTASIIFLVGFESKLGVPAGKHTTGTVTQVLSWEGSEEEILARFASLLAELATLPAVEKAKREAKPKADAPKGFTAIKPDPAARKALIEKVAKEKGVKVSPKAQVNGTPAAQ
jgi:hypothetical protein